MLWFFSRSKIISLYSKPLKNNTEEGFLRYPRLLFSGAPNDGFLSDPLKRYFRLSGVPLKLCRFILGCTIIFLSVRLF